ncbi:MAG: hypothetical protein IPJ60_18355 [Sphingobacteriaceae bacterium]|nr:hypothetical protein [Sphingobacteriaceae bacterium]
MKPGLKTYELKAISTNQKEEAPGMLFFWQERLCFVLYKGRKYTSFGSW